MQRPFKCLILVILFIFAAHSLIYATDLLQIGSKGERVREVQNYLYQLKYLRTSPNGYYGSSTAMAVESFQLEEHLNATGKVNEDTLEILEAAFRDRNQAIQYIVTPSDTLAAIAAKLNSSVAEIMVKNNLHDNQITAGQTLWIPTGRYRQIASRGGTRGIQELPWSIVNQLWNKSEVAKITDVDSGQSFQVKRYGGVYHIDAEPLTKQDTETMRNIYGGHWSWNRRAVIVECHNLYISGSMNGMPHGGKTIQGNNFRGQFCIHFLGSRVHRSGKVDTNHQSMVEQAFNANLSGDEQGNKESAPASIQPASPAN
jgi:peptidoglycan hydrolase-like protein with peptidoglycan-binding domain